MARTGANRWNRSSRMANQRARLIQHAHEVEKRIQKLTPLPLCAEALKQGLVTSGWFVRRLVDMGWTLTNAIEEFTKLKHSPGYENVSELTDADVAIIEAPPVPNIRHRRSTRPRVPSLPHHVNGYWMQELLELRQSAMPNATD